MNAVWICPGCGRKSKKEYRHGAVKGSAGPFVARELHHSDVTCSCGRQIPGTEIVGGIHDPPPLVVGPFLRTLAISIANAGFWFGVGYFFFGMTVGLVAGAVTGAAVWPLYFTGKISSFTFDR